MSLKDNISNLASRVCCHIAHVSGNEEATKQVLILPLLEALGYDIWNPTEVEPEYKADFAIKRGGKLEKVDYAIHLPQADDTILPAFFIESKAVNINLNLHCAQLARYYNATPSVKIGILSNGVLYHFFSETTPNIMDTTPFYTFNLMNYIDKDIKIIKRFTKVNFLKEATVEYARDLTHVNTFNQTIISLLRDPTESFTRYLIQESKIITGRITSKVIEKLCPLVKDASRPIVDVLCDPIESVAPAIIHEVICKKKEIKTQCDDSKFKIVTTQEELDCYDKIKHILKDPKDLGYKDTIMYFSIYRGGPKNWIIQLYFDTKQKTIATKLSQEEASHLIENLSVKESPVSNLSKSKVLIDSIEDIDKMKRLVSRCYALAGNKVVDK